MSPALHLLENEVQIAALAFLVGVYGIRLAWLFRFRSERERTRPVGRVFPAVASSLFTIARPWSMESVRRKPWLYAQFVAFHIGTAAAIGATFIMPYATRFFESTSAVRFFQALIALGLCAAVLRLIRRLSTPSLRLISAPDDYAALVLMICYFGFGIPAVAWRPGRSELPIAVFFGLTAFLLVYVPFSKIGHYLYYPFAQLVLGRMRGHRGVYPFKSLRKSAPESQHERKAS
jgi:hypothetical protein